MSEDLQAILSEPGKAVGKYFDVGQYGVVYVGADVRAWPKMDDGICHFPFRGTYKTESGRYKADGWDADCFDRVRKADPNRNLNLKVGMKVRLVNGDVVTIEKRSTANDVVEFLSSGSIWYTEDGTYKLNGEYLPYAICEVISEEKIAGGLLDKVNERLRKVEREIVDIKNAQRELEGLV